MKSKPAILIYFSCLFATALVFGFSSAVLAQEKATTKSQTARKPVKPVKKDADFWFNLIIPRSLLRGSCCDNQNA